MNTTTFYRTTSEFIIVLRYLQNQWQQDFQTTNKYEPFNEYCKRNHNIFVSELNGTAPESDRWNEYVTIPDELLPFIILQNTI